MGTAGKPSRVKLFCGLIYKDDRQAQRALTLLERHFGTTDLKSPVFDFSLTDYYHKEFGEGLKKRFIAFKKLIFPHDLPKIKTITNKLEKKLSSQGRRLVNLDPGYLDLAKVVLASTKDYVHRIYLSKGIYAEITLFYRNKTFNAWEWTYPDYRKQDYIDFFNEMRKCFASGGVTVEEEKGSMKNCFKKCSCDMIWRTRDDFLSDQNIEIIGYQVDFEKPEEGFFLFNHHKCKTTLGIKTFSFTDLYNGPIFTERKTGSQECPSYCLYKENLNRCLARCACAYVREIIQLIKAWPKNK